MAARKPAKRRQSAKQRRTGGRAKARSAPRAKTTKRVKSTAARGSPRAADRQLAPTPRNARGETRRGRRAPEKLGCAPRERRFGRRARLRHRGVRRPVSPVLLDRERRRLPESERPSRYPRRTTGSSPPPGRATTSFSSRCSSTPRPARSSPRVTSTRSGRMRMPWATRRQAATIPLRPGPRGRHRTCARHPVPGQRRAQSRREDPRARPAPVGARPGLVR